MTKTPHQIAHMRAAGRIAAAALAHAARLLRPGATTAELAAELDRFIQAAGAHPALKGYRGFPAAAAISINEEAIHGVPTSRPLREGDLVTVDLLLSRNGYYADCAWTWVIGQPSAEDARLLAAGEAALWAGIAAARAGTPLSAIGAAISAAAAQAGCALLAGYGGHGIGRRPHERPFVPNVDRADAATALQPGMALTVEPIVCAGDGTARRGRDRWTIVTGDGMKAAAFEHTIAITAEAPVILTAL